MKVPFRAGSNSDAVIVTRSWTANDFRQKERIGSQGNNEAVFAVTCEFQRTVRLGKKGGKEGGKKGGKRGGKQGGWEGGRGRERYISPAL